MKKLVCLVMILVVMMSSTAFAVKELPEVGTAYDMTNEWAINNGFTNYLDNEVDEDGFVHYCGMLSASAFEEETDMEFSIDNWRKWSMDYWKMEALAVVCVDSIDGNEIYMASGISNEEELTYDGYKKVKVIFMVCK